MNNQYSGSCETVLSLIKATNTISGKLTTSKTLQESLESIFQQFDDIPVLKKAWVFSQSDNDSFTNTFTYGDHTLSEPIVSGHALYPVLQNDQVAAFDFNILQTLTPVQLEENDRTFVFPSLINHEIMASSVVVMNCGPGDIETVSELLDIVFTKVGSIIARIDFERMIREQQTNLNNLLAGIDDMLFIVNENGRIIHFNASAQRTLGYNEEELSCMSLFQLKNEEDIEKTKDELHHANEKGSLVSYIPFVSTSNRAIPVETTISRGFWNSKPILILIARNLTDFENARNEIILSRIRAENANKAKSQFLRKMSHQFRVPLNSILGMTELMMKTDLSQKQFNFMNIVLRSTENLMGILNDILDFNKIENNEITLEHQVFNLKDVVQLVLNNGYYSTHNKGVELLSNFGKYGNALFVKGDRLRLFQVLMNLVQFCSDETQHGKIDLKVDSEKVGADKVKLVFRVTDTSEGLTPEELQELHSNIGSSSHDFLYRHAGSGLGLSIAWNLLKLMGSELIISSGEKGNDFAFELILDTAGESEVSADHSAARSKGHDTLSQSFRILLAEDQVFNQMVIQAMVEDWGLTIDIAENGAEALRLLNEKPGYSLVLMDIQMPLMDGMEATQKIRNEFPSPVSEIPIIAITAHAYADEHRKFLAAGMNDTVTKPFRSQVLFQKIANCLGLSRTVMAASETPYELFGASDVREVSYDLTLVRNITKGNQDAFSRMTGVFIDKSGEEMACMKQALKAHDWEMMASTAHKMKPALAYMGMKLLEQEVNNLYYLCKNQPDEILLKSIVESIDGKLQQVCEKLKNEKA